MDEKAKLNFTMNMSGHLSPKEKSLERPLMMLEKGKAYKDKVERIR